MLDLRAHLRPAVSHRDSNRKRIILAIMIKPDTQAGIARRTLLSQATVSTAVRDLEKDGIVRMERNSAAQGKGAAESGSACRARPMWPWGSTWASTTSP